MKHHFSQHSDLGLLDSIDLAMWVFDVDRHEMWWANAAGLKFWNCESLDELLSKDYSSDSPTVRDRLQALVSELPVGESAPDTWTLYPSDEPVTVDIQMTHLMIGEDKRHALLNKATPRDRTGMDVSDMRIAEATRYSSILISYFALDGTPVFMNPRANSVYAGRLNMAGSQTQTFFDRFADPAEGRQLFGACVSEGEISRECYVMTESGKRLHRVGLRLARDPLTGDRNVMAVEEDVTAARQAEHALAEKEVLLQDAIESLTDAFLLTDKNGRIVTANRRFKELYEPVADSIVPGVPFENVLRHAASQHLVPGQAGREEDWVQARLDKHMNPGDGYEQQMTDGSWMRVRESKTSTGGVAGIRVDITELKEAQAALAERERLLNDALESLDDAFLVTDKDGVIIACNSKYHEIYPMVADAARPGAHYKDVLMIAAKSGINPNSVGREAEWVEERYERHVNPGPAYEQQLSTGHWYRIHEAKTSDGGTAGIRVDITDLKEAEAGRAESERILVDAIDSLQDAFILTDKEDMVVVANKKVREEFPEVAHLLVPGVSFEEVLTEFARSGTPATAKGREEEWVKERLEQHRNPKQGFEMQLSRGRWIRLHETRTSDGGIASFRIDITEMKQAQQAVVESERTLKDAIESLGDAFILTDAEDKIVIANQKYLEFYKPIADVIKPGVPFIDVLRESAKRGLQDSQFRREDEWLKQRLDKHLNPGPAFEQYLTDGRWVRVVERRTSDGGIAGIRSDITELKRAEEAVAKSQDRLQDAVESLGDGFILTDAADRIVVANEKYKEYYHAIADAIEPGVNFRDLMILACERGQLPEAVGQEEAWLKARMWAHLNPGEPIEQQLADGRWLRVVEQRTSAGGIAGIRVDVTEIKKALERAEKASRAKSEFLSSMSHELRTPLNSVMGFAQVLEYDQENPLSERQSAAVNMIRNSGQHLLNLINEVLDLSRIESGKTEIFLKDVEAGSAIDESLAVAVSMADEHNVRIENRVANDTLPVIQADPVRFKQVLLNLLSNAIKYNREDGLVTISAETRSNGVLRVLIQDTGPGIAERDHRKVFLPFDRLGRESQNVEGTGVGLTISKSLIDLMGGQIGFDSELGEGSTFWIDLPIVEAMPSDGRDESEDNTPMKSHQIGGGGHSRALYIEDNAANVALMEQVFEMIDDADLIIARDAAEGLDIASSSKPDIVLMDIQLPGMSGIEATQALRGLPDMHDVPVIAVTAGAMKADRDKAKPAKFDAYVTKPIDVEELIDVMSRALNS